VCVALYAGWQGDTVVTSEPTLELECDEHVPVHWCYPRVYEEDNCMVSKATCDI